MTGPRVEVLGYSVANVPVATFVEHLIQLSKQERVCNVVTLNPEMIVLCEKQPDLKQQIQESLCCADGIGIVWASYILLGKKLHKVPGIDVMMALLQEPSLSFFLVGSTASVISTCTQILATYPARVVGSHSGYFDKDEEKQLISHIVQTKPDVVFVGLGFPKQQRFIQALSDSLSRGVTMGVGGAFDVFSGVFPRAPQWMRSCGMEWIFRAIVDPRRIRRWGCLVHFLGFVVFRRLFGFFFKKK